MVSLSMTLSDPWPGFQGRGSFKRRISPKRRILQTQLLYRTLIEKKTIGKLSIGKLAIQLTTPLLIHKPCKRFAGVARVCQRQLAFLVYCCCNCRYRVLSLIQCWTQKIVFFVEQYIGRESLKCLLFSRLRVWWSVVSSRSGRRLP